MKFEIGKYQVKIINESDYNPDSKDNKYEYEKKYLTASDYELPTKFGIKILENRIELFSALIGAEGGASGLHKTSQIIEHEETDTIETLDFDKMTEVINSCYNAIVNVAK